MFSINNIRFLRFLIIIATVVLTIFLYATYSSSTSLQPPPAHMRAVYDPSASVSQSIPDTLEAADEVARSQKQFPVTLEQKFDLERIKYKYSVVNDNANSIKDNSKNQEPIIVNINEHKKSSTSHHITVEQTTTHKKHPQHHRAPTIDVDAGGDAVQDNLADAPVNGKAEDGTENVDVDNSAIKALDDVLADEEHFVNNEMLDEQYLQNVENTLGNANGSNTANAAQNEQNIQRQQNQKTLANLNKISDSDFLIPTSNLQKFIENADKMLKNLTVVSPAPSSAQSLVGKSADSPPEAPQKPPSKNDVNADDADDSAVIVNEKKLASVAHAPSQSASPGATYTNLALAATKMLTKIQNITIPPAVKDPLQGIPTQQIYESGHMNEEVDIEHLCPNRGADLKLLILITSAQPHADARLSIRQTWGHYGIRRDVSTAFVLGRTLNETLNIALEKENFIYGDLIRGHFIDSYNNLTLKTISALEWVDTHCSEAKYILKTDDDMFINVPKLLAFLDSHSKEKRTIFGRLAKKWKPIRNKKSKYYVSTGQFSAAVFPPFTTGPAYVMTNDIVHELYERSLHQVYLKLEDVFTTGIVAQQLDIKRKHVNEFLNRRIAFNPCNIRKTISVHMIKSNEQFDLWKKLLDQSTKCK